jgi:hypothetical protein
MKIIKRNGTEVIFDVAKIEKAISKLYDESAEAIPNCIKNGKNYFYNVPISLDFHDAISIVKSMNKIWSTKNHEHH